jgi:hypothetical protein
MAFWTDTQAPEPLRQNRWYMRFGFTTKASFNQESTAAAIKDAEKVISIEQQKALKDRDLRRIETFQKAIGEFNRNLDFYSFSLKECSKPKYKIESSSHLLINHTFNYPKNVIWQPITITMASTVTDKNTLVSTLQYLLKKGGYDPCENPHKQISKELLTNQNGTVDLIQVDENGMIVDYWTLYNTYISEVDYGTLSYENDNFVDVKLTITYDFATFVNNELQLDMLQSQYDINNIAKSGSVGFPPINDKDQANRALNQLGAWGSLASDLLNNIGKK